MGQVLSDPFYAQEGDRVRIKVVVRGTRYGDYAGRQGVIRKIIGSREHPVLVVEVDEVFAWIELDPAEVYNYSLAVRRSWVTTPVRKTGRPRGRTSTKTPVSMRVEKDVWDALAAMVREGVAGGATSREQVVNTLLAEYTAQFRAQPLAAIPIADEEQGRIPEPFSA